MTKINCWVDYNETCDFTIYNLPFGIFSTNSEKRVGVAIGDKVLDLEALNQSGGFNDFNFDESIFISEYLNDFIALGKETTTRIRLAVQAILADETSQFKDSGILHDQDKVKMHLPVNVGDYTDFYSSIEHATNVGMMFRDPENALLPNWRHIPVGYHGRASSIVESGVPVTRPYGQLKPEDSPPVYSPTKRLDFELEMAFIIGKQTALGQTLTTQTAEDYIFGQVLFNDWSARDVQKWEYVPLGPFLAKSFASSISPWVVTMDALDSFRIDGPKQQPEVLPYLRYEGPKNFDIALEVGITPENGAETVVSKSNFKYMYWNMAQQLTHHTMNGCPVNIGDMMASGTISGKDKGSYGSMLELSWAGKNPVQLNDGSTRTFINDLDTVTMRGHAEKDGVRVGFGSVATQVLPATAN